LRDFGGSERRASTVTTSFHTGSHDAGTARVAALDGSLAAASRIV